MMTYSHTRFSTILLLLLCSCTQPEAENHAAELAPAVEQVERIQDWPWPIERDPQFEYVATTELPELDESLIQKVFYVDQKHPEASDDNPGSRELPFKTVSGSARAVKASLMNEVPTKLMIAEGLYREKPRYAFQVPKTASEAQQSTLLVIEGVPGKTILSGAAEEIDGISFRPQDWRPVEGEPGLYVNDWPYQIEPYEGPWINTYGFALLPRTYQRPEMIWIDGQHQRQIYAERYTWVDPDGVATMLDPGPGIVDKTENNQDGKLVYKGLALKDPKEMKDPGSFAVYSDPQTPEELRGKIFIRLDRPLEEIQSIEVGTWQKNWSPILVINRRKNFIIRGLTLTRNMAVYSCPALVVANAENFIVEDCAFNGNSSKGLSVQNARRGIVRRSEASHNATNGIGSGQSHHILFEDIATHFNNYRGAWEAFLGWDASGFKSGGVHNITIRRHASVGNYANGIWYDVYCTNILIEDSFYLGNQRMGVMIEFTRPNGGPQVVRNNVVAYNRTGVFVTMAANSVVENNLVFQNQYGHVEHSKLQTQLLYKFHRRKGGPQNAADWESVRIQNNIFASDEGALVDYMTRKSDPLKEFPFILEVLNTDGNHYYLKNPETAFHAPDGTWLDLAAWRELLATYQSPGARDASSTWAPVSWEANPANEFMPEAASDSSRIARAMGVPLPEDVIREYWKRVERGLYAIPYLRFDKLYD